MNDLWSKSCKIPNFFTFLLFFSRKPKERTFTVKMSNVSSKLKEENLVELFTSITAKSFVSLKLHPKKRAAFIRFNSEAGVSLAKIHVIYTYFIGKEGN